LNENRSAMVQVGGAGGGGGGGGGATSDCDRTSQFESYNENGLSKLRLRPEQFIGKVQLVAMMVLVVAMVLEVERPVIMMQLVKFRFTMKTVCQNSIYELSN
jgi:hypothetical protein